MEQRETPYPDLETPFLDVEVLPGPQDLHPGKSETEDVPAPEGSLTNPAEEPQVPKAKKRPQPPVRPFPEKSVTGDQSSEASHAGQSQGSRAQHGQVVENDTCEEEEGGLGASWPSSAQAAFEGGRAAQAKAGGCQPPPAPPRALGEQAAVPHASSEEAEKALRGSRSPVPEEGSSRCQPGPACTI